MTTASRSLNEFNVLVRYNHAVDIIHKVHSHSEPSVSTIVSAIDPFGFPTATRGRSKSSAGSVLIWSSAGEGFVPRKDVAARGREIVDKHKVMVSQTTSEHAGEAGKDGRFKLLSTVKPLKPGEICTFSYIVIGSFDTAKESTNLAMYLRTQFARFLVLQAVTSIHLSREKFCFLPVQNFREPWDDEKLIEKYGITTKERALIDSIIRPMEASDE